MVEDNSVHTRFGGDAAGLPAGKRYSVEVFFGRAVSAGREVNLFVFFIHANNFVDRPVTFGQRVNQSPLLVVQV